MFWSEYHEYQSHKNPELFNNSTALPQFLPVYDVPIAHPIPPLGYHGMTLQDGAVYFDTWPQGPVMFVDDMGQQHVTSMAYHPQLQMPFVAMGGAGPQNDASVPPFDPQLQSSLLLVQGGDHGTTDSLEPFAEPLEPMDTTDVHHSTIFNDPSEPAQPISDAHLLLTEQLAPGYSSTGLMTLAPLAHALELRTTPVEAVRADTNLPNSPYENARRGTKRKRQNHKREEESDKKRRHSMDCTDLADHKHLL